MLTYSFDDRGMDSLYEHLYKQIKKDIENGVLTANEKLPSKRAFSAQLGVSMVTVENAYAQLQAEGYIYSKPKSGYYVSDIDTERTRPRLSAKVGGADSPDAPEGREWFADLVSNSTLSDNFPFSTWTRLMRETMLGSQEKLMKRSPSGGVFELRKAIADYLYQFRGMSVSPNQIVVGAGTEYLYGLIIQLLGADRVYGVENPGYEKVRRIYEAHHVRYCYIDMDEKGVSIDSLAASDADVIHTSPSHHFPTGTVTPASRRYELLAWAAKSDERYIIEDEYDSEFRLVGKPIPALQSIDASNKVIYMNTFSKSLSSTIRISYMVLPIPLMVRYNNELSFYACTVSNFDQYTLATFIEGGYLEKHINRMRNYYRACRDAILASIRSHENFPMLNIREENSGLHFLIEADTPYSDREMTERAAAAGIRVSCLGEYCHGREDVDSRTLVINYSGVRESLIEETFARLLDCVVPERK